MKRLIVLLGMAAVLVALCLSLTPDTEAGAPGGQTQAEHYLYNFEVKDASADVPDSITDLFRSDLPKDYASIYGYWWIEYTSIDTAGASTDMDTTEDTINVTIYSGDADGTPYHQVYKAGTDDIHVTAALVNNDYHWFNISDSSLAEAIWWTFDVMCLDSTAALADSSLGCQYKLGFKIFAK